MCNNVPTAITACYLVDLETACMVIVNLKSVIVYTTNYIPKIKRF